VSTKEACGNPDHSGDILLRRVSSTCKKIFAFAVVITSCGGLRDVQAQVINEYEAKAAFLFNFVKFVEWPSDAFSDASAPLIIGVVGDDKSSLVIDQIINGKIANGRRILVKRFSNFRTLTACHMVFVRSSERERIRQTLEAAGSGTLTVGEMESFAHWGGVINFIIADGKLRLEINQTSAERAGLKISAKLLSLARVIRN
jgi:hypothetical protein